MSGRNRYRPWFQAPARERLAVAEVHAMRNRGDLAKLHRFERRDPPLEWYLAPFAPPMFMRLFHG